MRKILIFSIAYYPLVGGAEVAIKEITDRISGIRFDMITMRFDKKSPKFEKIGNIDVYRIGGGKLFFPVLACIKAIQLHKKNKYDAIWAMMANYAGFAALFFKICYPKTPFLLTLQEGDPLEYIKKRVRFVYPLFKMIFIKADFVQAISNYLADFARDMGFSGQLEVVPNAVAVEHFSQNFSPEQFNELKNKLGKKDGDKFVVTTSRLVLKNAADDVIKSLVYLPDNIKFLIIGTGPDLEKLQNLTRELKVEKRVIFYGYVDHKDMPPFLKVSDVFIRPSLSEGLGNSFLEAMAAEIPVIATPVGGIPDFLIDSSSSSGQAPTGWFCQVRNPQSIADKIRYIFDEKNQAEVKKITAKASQMVTMKYDWEIIAEKMNNIFEKLTAKFNILIATGIYPPDIGGPAQYAKNLVDQFENQDHQVKVLSYKLEKKLPIGFRHIWYFFRVIFNLNKVNFIIALDTFSVGLPAVTAAKIFNKKIIIRTGGDFFWESYVERSGNLITLKQFYEIKPALNLKEKIIFILSKYILKNSTAIAFSTTWQKEIFEKYYGLNPQKSYIIENYFAAKELGGQDAKEKKFLWAGRPIKLKNMERLKEAFAEAQKLRSELRLNIIQGMPYEKLLEEIKKSYVVILPSLSEISPNFILDAISCRKPFILTKESGYYEMLKSVGLFIDPIDKEDIKNKILFLADDKNYKEYKDKVMNFYFKHTWEEIAREFINIYKKGLH